MLAFRTHRDQRAFNMKQKLVLRQLADLAPLSVSPGHQGPYESRGRHRDRRAAPLARPLASDDEHTPDLPPERDR